MTGRIRPISMLLVLGLAAAGCRPANPPAEPALTVEPSLATLAPTPAPVGTALLTVTITQPPTIQPPTPPPTAPAVTATTKPTPTATPDDPAAGLPCPVENPLQPDYAHGGVGLDPLLPPDPTRTTPHLWLANPLAVEGMPRINRNFPYGSDSGGRYLLHNGLDLVEPPGTPILAVADGTVIVAGPDMDRLFGWRCNWYGNLVVVELDQKWDGEPVYVLYGHVLDIAVAAGERVRQGDPVAVIGVGGVATAPHLHLEVRVGTNEFGATRNPTLWVEPMPGYGTLAGRLVDPDGLPWQGVTITLIDPSGRSDFIYTTTYLDDPDHLINPDAAVGENFAFGYVPIGDYDVYTRVQDREYRQRVTIDGEDVTAVELVTEPYQTPTPEPASPSTTVP